MIIIYFCPFWNTEIITFPPRLAVINEHAGFAMESVKMRFLLPDVCDVFYSANIPSQLIICIVSPSFVSFF